MQPSDPTSPKPNPVCWRVVDAKFETSAAQFDQCPPETLPEVALAGRSNVGKSSLFNMLAGVKGLAKVSRTPGRTRLLNFFVLRMSKDGAPALPLRVVDLPGYGFAKVNRQVRESFEPMIGSYMTHRSALRALILLIDARRGPGQLDVDLLEYASQRSVPAIICITKADKLSASERGLLPRKFAQELDTSPRNIILTSTLLAALPGTMMPSSRNAPSRVSKWNFVSRCFSSGP